MREADNSDLCEILEVVIGGILLAILLFAIWHLSKMIMEGFRFTL